MDVFELCAKLKLDSSEFDKGLSGAAEKAKSIGQGIGNAVGTVAKVTAAGVAAAGTAVGALAKQSVDAYADYEQLAGGVETLFGKSAETVIANADRAYKSAGMSANDYMETSIQSAAALINSLGGDQAEAAKLMDMSITDMSDNVNKMGTSMEGVQNAYRGFSRGNFTMLDNLALGFAGTKDGMQQLLDKAVELEKQQGRTAEFSIDSYADIVKAIHIVQEDMGILGTTANEAEGTISGSINMLKGSWTNLVAGFANDQKNIGTLIDDFVNSMGTVVDNIIPVFERALEGIATFVERIAPIVGEKLPGLLQKVIPMLINAATKLFEAVAKALPSLIQTIINILPRLFTTVINAIVKLAPQLVALAGQLLGVLADGLIQSLPILIPAAVDVIMNLVETFVDNLDKIIDTAVKIIEALVQGIAKAAPKFFAKAPELLSKFMQGIVTNLPKLLNTATKLISQFVVYIVQNFPKIVGAAAKLIVEFIGGLFSVNNQLNNAGKKIITEVWNGLRQINPFQWGADLIANFVNGILSGIRNVASAVSYVGSTVRRYIGFSEPEEGPLSDFHTYAPDMIDLFIEGLQKGSGKLQKQLSDTFSFDAPTIASGASQSVYHATPITVNVYGAQGQDEKALADAVIERLNFTYNRQQRAFA